MGLLVAEEQFNRVLARMDIGKNEGAQVKTGGERNHALGKGVLREAHGFRGRKQRDAYRSRGDIRTSSGRPLRASGCECRRGHKARDYMLTTAAELS